QSTLRQVLENTENTQRQYNLRNQAVALGWSTEQLRVIDSDLGKSGAERDRDGFQQLITDVSLGRAGIVMGLEVSRLARNSMDWHRLLELCALSETLILDEEGLYDPAHFNDRLLLGMKGTLSEAELHILRARLQGGARHKARRGELKLPLPVGLVYDAHDRPILDPDQQVQKAIRLVFETFARTGSAGAIVRWFRRHGLHFPRRLRHGVRKGEVVWGVLGHGRVLQVLHNPRYAGAFVFGRTRTRPTLDGRVRIQHLPRDQWQVLLTENHPGYISWETFETNQRILLDNAQARGADRQSAPGEGPALLQGLVLCGRCGDRMTVRYTQVGRQLTPQYVCQRRGIETAQAICQFIPGAAIDQAVGRLLLETLSPVQIEVTLAVQREVQNRLAEADALRWQQVERARYEADLAQRYFLRVDPDNRFVAATLEATWNEKLRMLQEAQRDYERHRQQDSQVLGESTEQAIRALASDVPKLWQDPRTSHRDRKRLVRLLLEDVTLLKETPLTVHIRFKGGATHTLKLPRPLSAWQLRQTPQSVIDMIDSLLNELTDRQVAHQLNTQGVKSGSGQAFTARIVAKIRRRYGLKNRYDRLRQAGKLTPQEIAKELDIDITTLKLWRQAGRLQAHVYNDKGECLYEPLGADRPVKYAWQRAQRQRAGTHL
ncbi:MAG: recombinase family protein, partial [Verrucomicrobiales bacterium]|nr:recombinase family protein [Verrucomicrobiales bacterium]